MMNYLMQRYPPVNNFFFFDKKYKLHIIFILSETTELIFRINR